MKKQMLGPLNWLHSNANPSFKVKARQRLLIQTLKDKFPWIRSNLLVVTSGLLA